MSDIVINKKNETSKKTTPDLLSSSRGKFAAERRRNFKRKLTIFFIVLVLLITGFIFLIRIDKIRVNKVVVSETKVIDPVLVRDAVYGHIKGMYAWVIPKNSVFLLPLSNIHKDIENNFPYAKTVSVRRVGIDTIAVDITERKGVYLWCTDRSNTDCYFMDTDGYVFSKAPYFSGDVYARFYGQRSTNPNGTGNFQTTDKVNNIVNFFNMLTKHNLVPISFETGNGQNTITVKKSDNYVDILVSPDFVASDVDRTMSTLLTNTDFNSNFEKLSTIDLRFGNKIFYTYKGAKTEPLVLSKIPTETNSETVKKQD